MTRRARLTEAEIIRFDKAANKLGKVAVFTPQGVIFAESGAVALPSPDQDDFAAWKAKREGGIEGRS
jgi:hypothetical protein